MTSEPKSQAQSDETLIAHLGRLRNWLLQWLEEDDGDFLGAIELAARRLRALHGELAALTADHAEAFAGKVVLSQAAFEELTGYLARYAAGAEASIAAHPHKRDYYHGKRKGLLEAVDAIRNAVASAAESPTCPDCGTSLHLVCLECHPLRDDGGSVEVPKLDDEAQWRDVEAYLDGEE